VVIRTPYSSPTVKRVLREAPSLPEECKTVLKEAPQPPKGGNNSVKSGSLASQREKCYLPGYTSLCETPLRIHLSSLCGRHLCAYTSPMCTTVRIDLPLSHVHNGENRFPSLPPFHWWVILSSLCNTAFCSGFPVCFGPVSLLGLFPFHCWTVTSLLFPFHCWPLLHVPAPCPLLMLLIPDSWHLRMSPVK